jgi:tetratricopeptide (TPR) repeat protein
MRGIDPSTWTLVSPLLDEALELQPGERAAFLARVERSSPHVGALLVELLADLDAARASGFLESEALESADALVGTRVGAYTLEAPVGSGGMGTVWRARRSDGGFEGVAAVKFVNLAMLDGAARERFKREGTALARLSHPNIARLLDAGVSEIGLPYLVIDFVDGVRIDQYAAEHQLDIVARLGLFLQAADAVAHAHASLVVHRDLKPSNILVDRSGQVKLLDFGIATLIAQNTDEGAPAMGVTSRSFTPEFAAPEQVAGGEVTTATDVYALGVLLYALLTGQHPAGAGLRSSADLIRAITDAEALPPSAVVAHHRARRRLRGDLDTIVGKALKKNPAERYLSVVAMAEDVRRHLRHEPIGARPDTFAYRAATFARRHRWPLAAAIVTIAMLTGALFVADRERRIAERRFEQLRRLSAQVFALDTRLYHLAGATDAREALVAMSLEYLEGLAADAGSDRQLMREVTDHYVRVARIQGVPIGPTLGNFAAAEESLKKADALAEALLAEQPDDLRAIELSAAVRHDRMILADSERRDADAIGYARGAVGRIESLLADRRATRDQRGAVISFYSNVALAALNLRRYEEATRYARRHVELARAEGRGPVETSGGLSVLANALRLQGSLNDALTAIREARSLADQSPETEARGAFNRYGPLLREGLILGEDRAVSLERPADAIVPLRKAFEMQETSARADPNDFASRSRIGTAGRELGNILRWQDPREALAVYDIALGRLREIKDNVKARRDTALVLASSAYALRRLNRAREAQQRIDEALTILTATSDHPADRITFDSALYNVLLALADHRADTGQVPSAVASYTDLLAKVMHTGTDVENDLRNANTLSLLYDSLARAHRLAGAEEAAAGVEAKRRALWQDWDRKLPDNAFVARRLATPGP